MNISSSMEIRKTKSAQNQLCSHFNIQFLVVSFVSVPIYRPYDKIYRWKHVCSEMCLENVPDHTERFSELCTQAVVQCEKPFFKCLILFSLGVLRKQQQQ